jgi:hypothetical protein
MRAFSRRRSSEVEQGLELSRKAYHFELLIVPSSVAATMSCLVAIDSRGSKPYTNHKLMIKMDKQGVVASPISQITQISSISQVAYPDQLRGVL